MRSYSDTTVQAGTPMTVIGEVSLSPWLEAGRLLTHFIYSKISRGTMIGLPIVVGQSPFLHRLDGGACR